MMLDLHIEGAAPVTLLVRDESRSTRSTSVNKEDDLDPLLDFQDASCSSAASPPLVSKDHLQKRTTSSEDEPSSEAISGPHCTTSTSRKMAASIALQIVDSDQEKDQDNTTSLTLAQEIASFEFIDEKTSSTSSPISSLASDFDVWSPRDKDTTSAQLEEEDAILAYASDAGAVAGKGSGVGGLISVEVGGGNKKRFLDLLEAKNLLTIP